MAAVGAAMQIAELKPRAVVAVGTCGAYAGGGTAAAPGMGIGDVIVSRRVRLADAAALAGLTQFPEPMSVSMDAHPTLADALASAGAHRVDVATTLGITVDDATAARTAAATGAHVEHLEAFGIAAACAARGVPFCAVLGVANTVGARARAEWRAHHREAATAAVELVLRWLRAAWTLPSRGSFS
jgi:nucleoside phosphorylase